MSVKAGTAVAVSASSALPSFLVGAATLAVVGRHSVLGPVAQLDERVSKHVRTTGASDRPTPHLAATRPASLLASLSVSVNRSKLSSPADRRSGITPSRDVMNVRM